MKNKNVLHEIELLKKEIAALKSSRGFKNILRKAFTKTSILIGIASAFIATSIIIYAATISKPYTFTDGTVISAAEVNGDFDALYTESNAQHTRIATLESHDHGIQNLKYIICYEGIYPTSEGSTDTQFIGEIKMFAGTFAPGGWKYCDGSLLQITQYMALFSIIGFQYGGDGQTTFALPDLRGKTPVHPK